ncbi:MAG: pirin family protein [Candidatus Nanopelagicales bacterium]
MTNLEVKPELLNCESSNYSTQVLKPRSITLTTRSGIKVDRLLPNASLRMIGAWCFLDHFLPQDNEEIMSVAAHPHTGLQTVTWLFSGEVKHHDSLGSNQVIQPGELNLMTAGRGISHSEVSNKDKSPLHGVQLWVALDEKSRNINPKFNHYADLPVVETDSFKARIIIGEMFGVVSKALAFSPLVAAEITFSTDSIVEIALDESFEYGFMPVNNVVQVSSQEIQIGELYYQSRGAEKIEIRARADSKILLIGGAPFEEEILMWWNFVARSHEEIEQMRELWQAKSEIFGEVADEINERIPAPSLPSIKLKPRANKKLG